VTTLRAFARLTLIHVLIAKLMAGISPNSLLLRGARIIAPDGLIQHGAVLIETDRIARVLDAAPSQPPATESVIDLDGLTLFPGFIDVHIHGAVGVDTMAAGADDLRRVGEFLARNGVTAWLPTLVPSPHQQYERAISAIEQAMAPASIHDPQRRSEYRLRSGFADSAKDPTEVGTLNTRSARILGVHYEGPFVNSEQCGALHREHFRTFSGRADVDSLPTIENDSAVHMMTLAPEIQGGIELIKELHQRGWAISIGHTRASLEVLDQALAAGAGHMTHFMNAMPPLHQRAPGPVGWGLLQDDVTCDVIADGVHLDPMMLKLILRSKAAARVSLISDAIAAAGLGAGEYEVWGEKISVNHGRTQNARGSIAGSVITMLDAARMMSSLGASEVEVARMASTNPARLLGIDHDCGSIEEGKRADLVAVDDELNVRLVVIGGQRREG
jgi:N-acetylglucosamine-6-phosphate deacetylase